MRYALSLYTSLAAFALMLAGLPQPSAAQTTPTIVLAAEPTRVTLTQPVNGPAELTAGVVVRSNSTAAVAVTASASSDQNWLLLRSSSQTATIMITGSVQSTQPFGFNVVARAQALPAGTYQGAVVLTAPGAAEVRVPVELTVGGGGSSSGLLTVTPATLDPFVYTLGTGAPVNRALTLRTTSATPIGYTVTVTPVAGTPAGVFVAAPVSGTVTADAPQTVDVGVNPLSLPAGNYSATLSITPTGSQPIAIQLALTVQSSSTVTLPVTSLLLRAQNGATSVTQQFVPVLVPGGGATQFTVAATSANNILFAAAAGSQSGAQTGTAPGSILIGANTAGLAAGSYTGTVTVTFPNTGLPQQTIDVTIQVVNEAIANVYPSQLTFDVTPGAANPILQRRIRVTSSSTTELPFTATVTSTCNCLSVPAISNTTPTDLVVTLDPTNITTLSGSFSGLVTLTIGANTTTAVTRVVPVVVNISSSATLDVTQDALVFRYQGGQVIPPPQSIDIRSTVATTAVPFAVNAITANGGNWLVLSAPSGAATPASVQTSVNVSGLADGVYTGAVTVSSVSNGSVTVPVYLVISNQAALTATPSALSFAQTQLGVAPPPQTVSVTSTGGALSYTVTTLSSNSAVNFISVTPTSGITPGSFSVSVNGQGLAAGQYQGTVTITATGVASSSTIVIPVVYTVAAAPALAVSTAEVNLEVLQGATAPVIPAINVTATGNAAIPFTATAASATPNFLTATTSGGTTPATVTAAVNTAGLAPGTYTGTISLASAASPAPVVITVRVTVTPRPTPVVASVVNNASYLPGAVAPGELVALFGSNLGPATLTPLQVANGAITTTLGGVRVLFDSVEAPLVYVRNDQIGAIVPFQIAGRVSTRITVNNNGVVSAPIELRLADAAPGLFTANSSGSGQGAFLNQNLSANSAGNPIPRGQVAVLYATGLGAVTPQPAREGLIATSALARTSLPVRVLINNVDATVEYSGTAEGLLFGVFQINVRVPLTAPTGSVAVQVVVGGQTSQTATLAIQ